jgi:ribose transport system permease protein
MKTHTQAERRELGEPASTAGRAPSGRKMRFYLTNEFGLVILIIAFSTLFTAWTPGFLSPFNLFAMGREASVNVVTGLAMMVVIVTGGLDLSLGAIGVSAAMAGGWLMQVAGVSWPLALIGALGVGGILGFLNGWLVTRTGLHSFIITLATMSIFFGAMIFLTHAESFRNIPPIVSDLGQMKIFRVASPLLLVALAATLALVGLYRLTPVGREMLAAGARAEAAELSGVRVKRVFVLCHTLTGVLAGLAAAMVVARNGAAIPSMAGQLGQDWLLPAFLGPVLGGTLLSGGQASPVGTFLGAVLVTVLTSGLLLQQIGEFWVQSILGVVLLVAVLLDYGRRTLLARRRML